MQDRIIAQNLQQEEVIANCEAVTEQVLEENRKLNQLHVALKQGLLKKINKLIN